PPHLSICVSRGSGEKREAFPALKPYRRSAWYTPGVNCELNERLMPVSCAPVGMENAKLSKSDPLSSKNVWPLIVLTPDSNVNGAFIGRANDRSPETASLYVTGDAAARAADTSTSAATPPTRTRAESLLVNPNCMERSDAHTS